MNKIIINLLLILTIFAFGNCATLDKSKVGEKEVIMVTKGGVSLFGMNRAAMDDCLEMLNKEGATEVTYASGVHSDSAFRSSIATISTTEMCEAIGQK